MESTRTKNTILNFIWGMSLKVVMIIIPFIVRTIIIKTIGIDYLGLNSLFASILNVLSLAELGISNVIVCSMYKPIAENDRQMICALLNLYKKLYRIVGIIILTMGLICTPFIPYVIKGETPKDVSVFVLFLIYLSNISLSYFMFAYKSCLLVAHQKNSIISKIQILCNTIQGLLQIAVLIVLKDYYIYILLMPLFTIINNILVNFATKKEYPEYICNGTVDDKNLKIIKQQVAGLMIGRISSTLRNSVDSLYISIFLGLYFVGVYNNYFYIVTVVIGILQVIETSMIAGVGNAIVTENAEKNYYRFNKFIFYLQWVVALLAICVLCLIQPFMKMWVGEKLMLRNEMSVLCAVYIFVMGIGAIRSVYTQALGMWWELNKVSIVDVFVNVFLNLVFVKIWGVYGVLFATIIDIVFVSIPWTGFYLFKGYFGIEKFKKYLFKIMSYSLWAFISGIIVYFACQCISFKYLFLEILCRLVVCFLLLNVLYILRYRKNQYIREIIPKLRGRKR